MPTKTSVHLIAIGKTPAIPAGELKVGDTVVWNYGYTNEIIEITQKGSMLVARLQDPKDPNKVYERRFKPTTLVAIREPR